MANAFSAIAYDSIAAAQQNNTFDLAGHGGPARAAIRNDCNEILAATGTAG